MEDLAIYRENVLALHRHRPELTALLPTDDSDEKLRIVPTSSGLPNVARVTSNLNLIPYYDVDDPSRSVAEDLEGTEVVGRRLVVLFGMGLGYEVLHFLTYMAKRAHTSGLIVIEADPAMFRLALRTTRLAPALSNPSVYLLVGLDRAGLYTRLFELFKTGRLAVLLKTLGFLHTRGCITFYGNYYAQAARALKEAALEATENFGNAPHDSLIGLQNMLLNAPLILRNPGINELKDVFRGRPAVVISTGPSLNKNIDQLKDLEPRALLVAADASLAPLLQHGIRPHLVASLERVPNTAELFRGLDASDIWLAGCPVLDPRAYAAYRGPTVITYRAFDHFRWLGIDKGMLTIGPSSGNMAFKIAEFLGCDPIILVGQDLCFAEDGRSHASGAALGERQIGASEDSLIEVPGNLGRPVKTQKWWFKFLRYYEYDVTNYRGTCINATEGGAYIAGTVVMPLREAVERYLGEPFWPRDLLQARLSKPDEAEVTQGAERVARTMQETFQALIPVVKLCEQGFREAHAVAERFVSPDAASDLSEGEASIEAMMELEPLRRLEALRTDVITREQELFQLFMAHSVQPYLLSWQMDFYASQLHATNRLDLAQRLALAYKDWFNTVGGIIILSLRILKLGEKVLRAEFPRLQAWQRHGQTVVTSATR